jgi:stearoyl-CoA desaturase (Delta-9 desaturase)
VSGFLWGGAVRLFVVHHVTWSINSICHLWGSRDYQSHDQSRNNFVVGLLAMGEGWHNNHHAFPTSARHGLEWWQFDVSWILIRTLAALGLASNVRIVPIERRQAMRSKSAR